MRGSGCERLSNWASVRSNRSLAAEQVAVTISRYRCCARKPTACTAPVWRALAAVLNDEASHLLVMIEMDARAEAQFPEFPFHETKSPLLSFGMDTVTSMHPGLAACLWEPTRR